ncbi:MAG: RpiB/LacA/LacB family sugar-phosphate isomerase [Caldilinea sp.]|nr:RpiB/LacA/LacB family sugar-phosphate isomerase [Caldilinea sp.]MDW8440456.1 RpiB/LacA/LacB family sugar-phosphate isomerase [Caldilineaceae bacterium]
MDKNKPIVIGADHYGLPLKDHIRNYLIKKGYQVVDMGVNENTPVDYPDVGAKVAEEVGAGKFERGILVCGTGAGMAIVANKVPGVRAVCVQDPYTAERAVASNNAQIITFGAQITGPAVAEKLIDIWLESEFQGGRSAPKVAKIDQLDEKYRAQRAAEG